MSDLNQASTPAQESAPTGFSLVRTVPFNFKRVREQDLLDSLETEQKASESFMSQFEVITEGEGDKARRFLKRKSFQAKITLPSFVADLPEDVRDLVASILEREIQQFCKTQYVDSYEPIGAHDFETYKQAIASRAGRSVSWDYSEDQFKLALESLQKYITKATGHAGVGEKIAAAAKQKFTRSAIQRYLGNFDEVLLKKISARLNDWATHLAENEASTADEVLVVWEMWTNTLDKHLKADNTVDVSQYL